MAATVAAFGVSGCASISTTMADKLSQMPAIGLPSGAPERAADPGPFPAVHDMPPGRSDVLLNDIEQRKLEDDLVAARDQQQATVGLPPIKKKQAAKDAKSGDSKAPIVPVSSRQTIY